MKGQRFTKGLIPVTSCDTAESEEPAAPAAQPAPEGEGGGEPQAHPEPEPPQGPAGEAQGEQEQEPASGDADGPPDGGERQTGVNSLEYQYFDWKRDPEMGLRCMLTSGIEQPSL